MNHYAAVVIDQRPFDQSRRSYVLDSCVFLAGLKPEESGHALASAMFEAAKQRDDQLLVAATSLWDMIGGVSHPAKREEGAPFSEKLMARVHFISVDHELFFRQARIAVHRLPMKGPDLVVLSVAMDKKAPLISTDPDMLNYGNQFGVRVMTPAQYLAEK